MGLLNLGRPVGLYLDSNITCVMPARKSAGPPADPQLAEFWSPNIIHDAAPEQKQQVVDNLKMVFTKAAVSPRDIFLAVPGEASITRIFELPIFPKKSEERSAVRFEAQKYIPFDLKELYHDYQAYPDMERKRTGIVFFACKKQWVDTLGALLTLTSSKISVAELACQSVARSFYLSQSNNPDEVVVVVSSNGDKSAEIIVEKEGAVLSTRHFSMFNSERDTEMDPQLLMSELRISMDYFSENFKSLKVNKIFIATPFEGNLQSLCESLSTEFSIPADSGTLVPVSAQTQSATAQASAFGLASRNLGKKNARNINLKAPESAKLPAEALTWEEERKLLQDLLTKEIIIIALVLGLIFAGFSWLGGQKANRMNAMSSKLPPSKSANITEPLNNIKAKQQTMQARLAMLTALVEKRTYLTPKLNELVKTVPANILLSKMTYRDTSDPVFGTSGLALTLEGYVLDSQAANDFASVNKFLSGLNENKDFMSGFESVKVVSNKRENFRGQYLTKFVLECVLKKVPI